MRDPQAERRGMPGYLKHPGESALDRMEKLFPRETEERIEHVRYGSKGQKPCVSIILSYHIILSIDGLPML